MKRRNTKAVRTSMVIGPYGQTTSKTLSRNAIISQARESRDLFNSAAKGWSQQTVRALDEISGESSAINYDGDVPDFDMEFAQDPEWETEGEPEKMNETFVEAVQSLTSGRWATRHPRTTATWRSYLKSVEENWAAIFDTVLDTYKDWYAGISKPIECDPTLNTSMRILDIYDLTKRRMIHRPQSSLSIAVDLARVGYLATSPKFPTLAISFKTLELFRRLRLRKPSFSVEAFARVICDLYIIPYRRRYHVALTNAFDVYIQLRRKIDSQVKTALEMDCPDFRIKHGCPACCYEVKDEGEVRWRRMIVLDGNNTLKRLIGSSSRDVADRRQFNDSDYILPPSFVDQFKDEVPTRPKKPAAIPQPLLVSNTSNTNNSALDGAAFRPDHDHADHPDSDSDHDREGFGGGDPTGQDTPGVHACADDWKAARGTENQHMWSIFEAAGIFAGACRHGRMVYIADMIRSGELAKYPLAMVSKALDLMGDRLLVGYDIGCTFGGTLSRSSLGPKFSASRSLSITNAFHWYTHNMKCQLNNHPNVIEHMGIEDLETLERVFSTSNALGSITRHMSRYRHHVAIEMFFEQWDADKYLNLAEMLFNNYKQALEIIDSGESELEGRLRRLGISEARLDQLIVEEREAFNQLDEEPETDVQRTAYVDRLQKLSLVEQELNKTNGILLYTPEDPEYQHIETVYNKDRSLTAHHETARKVLNQKRSTLMIEIAEQEQVMKITVRWTPQDQQYRDTLKLMTERRWLNTLDEVHRLVVQRYYELQKLNLAGTSYKLRTHMSKSLQKRTPAIKRAVILHNDAAAKLGKLTLDWQKVMQYQFFDQFSVLRQSRHDVALKDWAKPEYRETMKLHLRIKRAREEITRCNLETRRIHTSIVDERKHFQAISSDPLLNLSNLMVHVREYIARRKQANRELRRRLNDIYMLPGYTGTRGPGIVKEPFMRAPIPRHTATSEGAVRESEGMDAGDVDDIEEDDGDSSGYDSDGSDIDRAEDEDVQGDVTYITDYISQT